MALNLAIFATDAVATTTENLLNNPGGESDTDGWDNVEGTLKSYSSVGDGDNKVTPKSGTRLLAFNEDINKAKASQTVDVSPYKGAITNAKFSGYIQGYGNQRDSGELWMTFLTEDKRDIKTYKTDKVKGKGWQRKEINPYPVPQDTHFIKVWLVSDGERDYSLTVHFDDLSLTLDWKKAGSLISPTSLDFGNLYVYDKDYDNGAEAYNKEVKKDITIENTGDEGSTFNWEIKDIPKGIEISEASSKSGSLSAGAKVTVTLWLNPTSSGNLTFKINDTTISVYCKAYSTPRVILKNLTHPNNNSLNIGPNEKITLNVDSGKLSYPAATIGKYEWQYAEGDLAPDLNRWSQTGATIPKKDFIFPQAMNYTIYCRMVDSNGVATDYEGISVRVWNKPEITGGAGSSWYNMDSYFYGVVNQPLSLKAEVDENGNEAISKAVWTMDDEVIAIAPGSPGLVCDIYQVPSNNLSSYNLTQYERYVKDNDVEPSYTNIFETVNFPDGSVFKHATQKDANGNLVSPGINNDFLAKFSGVLDIKTPGRYDFYVGTDGGFRLKIGNKSVVYNYAKETNQERSGSYNFSQAGYYPIELSYCESSENQRLELYWKKPGADKQIAPTSAFNNVASYTPTHPTLSGDVKCQVFTNYGIPSKEKSFPFRVYDLLKVNVAGDQTGSPNRSVSLVAEIPDVDVKYPGYLKADYIWDFEVTPNEKVDAENKVEVKWNEVGEFKVKVTANLFTKENLSLTKTSKPVIIAVVPAKPTAFPDGPYRGGIKGGDYSPIQFEGNSPDYIEAPEIGKIKAWEWAFLSPSGGSLKYDGIDDYCSTDSLSWAPTEFTVSWWLNPDFPGPPLGDIPGMPGTVYFAPNSIGGGDFPAWGKFQFLVTGTGAVIVGTDVATCFNEIDLPANTVDFNQWQHFTFTYEIITDDLNEPISVNRNGSEWMKGKAAFYKNGVRLAYKEDMLIPRDEASRTWDGFYIGSSKGAHTISGKVDDVAIWQRAIEPEEVSKFVGTSPENELDCFVFWDFNDEDAPGNDVIGLDHNLTLYDDNRKPTWLDSDVSIFDSNGGIRNGALKFDGVDDCVKLNNNPFTNNGDFTIALWANTDVLDGNEHGLIYADDYMPSLKMTADGGLYYCSYQSGSTSLRYEGTISGFFAEVEEWVHITWVKEGTSYRFYLDGRLQHTRDNVSSTFEHDSPNPYYNIGKFKDKCWDGYIDEFCIWNVALDEGQVEQIKINSGDVTDGLVLYWNCDEGTGITVLDQSPQGKNGTLYGPKWLFYNKEANSYNATFGYDKAGTYSVVLRVRSEYDIWSNIKKTTTTVIDGLIEGLVKAADLRTPVKRVRMTLRSAHVDPEVLASVASEDESLFTTSDGAIYTLTADDGSFSFHHLPLGSYRLIASKVEESGIVHEFENPVQTIELSLESPNKYGALYVDLSVFPVSGRITYSLKKFGKQDVFVKDVIVVAQPAGNASPMEALPSEKFADSTGTNYNMPLFAGKYLFIAKHGGHVIRINEDCTGYDKESKLVTIKNAVTDIDFVDYTTRKIFVYIEDSGEFPIDTYKDNKIQAQVNGDNGFAEGEVITEGGKAYFKAVVPPGKYAVSLPNVPTAYVKGETAKRKAEVDVEGNESYTVTMVVPVPLELEIGPEPKLFPDVTYEELQKYGVAPPENPEGFMVYMPDESQTQTHIYTIEATANGNPVEGVTLKVIDEISQPDYTPPEEKTYPDGERYQEVKEGGISVGKYTVSAGLPKMTVVVEDDPSTYVEYTLPHDETKTVKIPKVLPKKITFEASKEGYNDSQIYTLFVTVLGDVPEGTSSEVIAVPNMNYLVLHDPPGDGSYSYFDDSFTLTGIVNGMKVKSKGGKEIPVFPSPWSEDRRILGDFYGWLPLDFDDIKEGDNDLGNKGILDPRRRGSAAESFGIGVIWQVATGLVQKAVGLTGPPSMATMLVNAGLKVLFLSSETSELIPQLQALGKVQYEISPSRHLETPSEDDSDIMDLMGPGRGDVYYGEGWSLGLQTKFRLGIKMNEDAPDDAPNYDPNDPTSKWLPDSAQILTYAILEQENQYSYTVRDIEKIIDKLELQIAGGVSEETGEDEIEKLKEAKTTWESLLNKNPAYVWLSDHIEGNQDADRDALMDFLKNKFGGEEEGQMLIFSGGQTFEYSRRISEGQSTTYSEEIGFGSFAESTSDLKLKLGFFVGMGGGTTTETGGPKEEAGMFVESYTGFGGDYTSGSTTEQTVGFVLHDDDVGDNISTYVYEGPWGTPIFFTDPGSVTSDPWDPGTNKAVDFSLELIEAPGDLGTFDYHGGAHYRVRVSYIGRRVLDFATVDSVIYDYPYFNQDNLTALFNGDRNPYVLAHSKMEPSIVVAISLYPPGIDQNNNSEKEYSIGIEVDSVTNPAQINRVLTLKPQFADLRSPRATIIAPYDGQRISPKVFTGDENFLIQAFSDDYDLAKVQIEIRSKKTDGVWEPWRPLSGMVWADKTVPEYAGADNSNVTIVPYENRDPVRQEFTFLWSGDEIAGLGAGEYALRAVAEDKATRFAGGGSEEQILTPNVDLDAPAVTFQIDGSKPTVLTTVPFYQDKESERIYRGELTVAFNDDMRAGDFSDRTFEVTDLLDNKVRVAGFVSYSPALRKALFVPQVPFKPNGFYFVTIKTDTIDNLGELESGVHDLAGNPLDNEFTFTFRTKDTPFEETWSIVLSAEDVETDEFGNPINVLSTDANNIASVAYGAYDGEDETDAYSVPKISSQFDLSFLTHDQVELDRDTRPADGRLSHHWFFAIRHPEGDAVTIKYRPSSKLAKSPDERQYKVVRLTEFDETGNVSNDIQLFPEKSEFDTDKLEFTTLEAYTYTPKADETIRHFRLDVKKASFVATVLERGTSDWQFFSAPITPLIADPFVNLGDDIEPFKLYQYDTTLGGYKIYPLDIGEVALQTGHGYFIRLENDVEVDIGGAANNNDIAPIELDAAGWHAIGNPYVKPVNVVDLKINGQTFNQAVSNGLIGGTVYGWKVDSNNSDAYQVVGQMQAWEGHWFETKADNLTLTIPAPEGLGSFVPPLPDSYQPPMAPPVAPATHNTQYASGEFDLRFELTSDFASDLITALGTRQNAKVGFDLFDASEPPILKGTVAAYFNHKDWQTEPGWYNTNYQPSLKVSETRTWKLVAYTDKPKSTMQLSWERAIEQAPSDTMLYFRNSESEDSEWMDMRQTQFVILEAKQLITKETFEIRAERFALELPETLSVIAGEKQVTIQWAVTDNPFITGYTIAKRMDGRMEGWKEIDFQPSNLPIIRSSKPSVFQFVDTDVEEEATYIYQISVHFKTGAELKSKPFTVTVLPGIEKTVLLQNYPNPFNPDTWIPYELDSESDVKIDIYNVNGHLVKTIHLGAQPRGRYISKGKSARWDGRTNLGERAANGVYFYIMRAGKFTATRKMVILK